MMLPLVTIAAAMSGGPTLNRRAMLGAAAAAFVATSPPAAAETPAVDFTTKSAFFGLAAPPVVGMLRYDELVEQARTGQIATLQIAVQHDTVIATDRMGHRFACMMRDEELPHLILDATGKDGSMPFEVLPMDENRAKVRDAAFVLMNLYGLLWVADLAGVLPWDTTPYSSLAEREEAQRSGQRSGEARGSRRLFAQLRSMSEKSRRGAKSKASKASKAAHGSVTHDEALRRVLGLSTWDAEAELLAERLAGPVPMDKGARDNAQDKRRPHTERKRQLDELFVNTERKRQLDELFVNVGSRVRALYTEAWAMHARKLAQARPYMLERRILQARPAELERQILASYEKLEARLREAPWVTPETAHVELPSLERLLEEAWRVSSDGLVECWIRAHPTSAYVSADGAVLAFPKASLLGGPWPIERPELMPELKAEIKADVLAEVSPEHGVCRLCPEFSALYNHDVYICKRLAMA